MEKLSRKEVTKKKRIEEDKNKIPEGLKNVTLPRSIDLDTFINARKLELEHFLGVLSGKAAVGGKMGNKKSFQLLPKHMRRRAMSHNAHRVPAKIRILAQSSALLRNPCRKTRRTDKKTLRAYMMRNQKAKWLENHIWHAKRMKMQTLWGYKIQMKSNDKGIRAVYRYLRDFSIVFDSSFYKGIKIFDKQFVNTILKVPFNTKFRCKGHIYMNGNLICPVESFEASDSIIIMIHPAASEDFKSLLTSHNAKFIDLQDQISIYKLRGPRSAEMMLNAFEMNKEARNIIEAISGFHNFKLKDGAILSVKITKKLCKTATKKAEGAKSIIPVQPGKDLIRLRMNWPDDLYGIQFWNEFTEELDVNHIPQKITTRSARSRYPAARPKPKTETKLIEEIPKEQEFSIENPENIENPMEIDEILSENKKYTYINALLVYNNNEFADGWDVIMKSEDTCVLWRSLVYSGCRAVGLQEFNSMYYEQGELCFPNDYPMTNSYLKHSVEQAKEKIADYFKRPSSKRMNYERIASPFPFYSDWLLISQSDLIPVKIKCLKRCPKALAYICLPNAEDLKSADHFYKEPLKKTEKLSSKFTLTDIESLKIIETSRKIIGFITTGGFSFSRSKGFGIGYISSSFKPSSHKNFLFRNPSSQFYHLCSLKEIIPIRYS